MAQPQVHMAPQQPHIMAMPHANAPTHMAMPRGPSPQIAHQNFARPNMGHANIGRPNNARPETRTFARHNGPSATPHNEERLSRHVSPPTPTNQAGRNAETTRRNAETNGARELNNLNRRGTPSTPNAVGQANENRTNGNRSRTVGVGENQPGRAQIYAGNRRPVLHNQVLASNGARDAATRALGHSTFQGGFAQFRDRSHDHDRDRFRDRFRGRVLGWIGPVFWPYAETDLIDYAYWPYADDTFWPYAYDDVYDSLFGGYAPDLYDYASADGYVSGGGYSRGRRYANTGPGVAGGGAEICSGQVSQLTDFPIQRIAQQVQPNDRQQGLLDQLKAATEQAVNILISACPTDLPSTPTGRLATMRSRIEAMLRAVNAVRPALDKFYDSLSDEQKERFNSLEPTNATTASQSDLAQVCGGRSLPVNLPIGQIEQALRPSDAQDDALHALDDASRKAADILQANCPQGQNLTPTGRVAAMEQRLSTMLQAIDTVQPALTKFYGSLSDEQKARFDRLRPHAT